MSEPSKSPPALVDLLTREEQQVLATKVAEALKDGFGDITIKVQNHVVRFIEGGTSVDLTKIKNGGTVGSGT